MNLNRLLPVSRTTLLALIATAATTVACSNAAEDKKAAAWACQSVDVPEGVAVRCTQQAINEIDYGSGFTPTYVCTVGDTSCPSPSDYLLGQSTPSGGDADPCTGVNDNPDLCPPSGGSGTGGGTTSSSSGSTTTGGSGTGGGTTSSSSGSTTTTGGSGTGGGSTGGGEVTTNNGSGNGNGNAGGGNGGGKNHECEYTPDLPYCGSGGGSEGSSTSGSGGGSAGGGSAGGGTGGSNGGSEGSSTTGNGNGNGASSGGTGSGTCEHGNCDSPGQQKKNGGSSGGTTSSGGAAGGGSSEGSSGSNGKGGGGSKMTCTKDEQGNTTCTSSTPQCAPGTHAGACGACIDDGSTVDCVPPSDGGCWVTGGGFIEGPNLTTGAAPDGHDNFGGNAKPMKDGSIQGHWNHVDHGTGNHASGHPAYIVCRHVDEPGPGQPGGKKGFTMNQVYFGGPAEWSEGGGPQASGYWFDVVAKDHGEPGSVPSPKNGGMVDTYHFTIRKMDDPTKKVSGAVVYETKGGLSGGNIQLHPPNPGHPYTPSALPSWVSYEP